MTSRFVHPTQRPRAIASRVLVVFVAVMLLASQPLMGQQTTSGTSSRQARKQTVASLPYDQLTQDAKQKLSRVLKNPSFYRRLPATAIEADPEYLQFLVRHPEVIVNIWQLMGITKMSAERTGPFTLRSDDGAGTISDLELMFGSHDLHIYYGHGTYEGPVIRRPLHGDCVLVLKTTYRVGPAGTPIATNELDVFLKVDNATANLVAKTLQPLIGPTADHNFVESLKFVQRLNKTTEQNGPGVQGMAKRFAVTPQVRDQFIQVAGNVFERASRAALSRQPSVPMGAANAVSSIQPPAAAVRLGRPSAGANGRSTTGRNYGHRVAEYPAYGQPARVLSGARR